MERGAQSVIIYEVFRNSKFKSNRQYSGRLSSPFERGVRLTL